MTAVRPDLPIRLVGVATAAYSITITWAPKVLAVPVGLAGSDAPVPLPVAELTRSIGVRDAALALALVAAPNGYPLTVLTVARVLCDGADAWWFGRLIRGTSGDRRRLAKVCGAALGWAALEAAVGWWAVRGRARTAGG